MKIVEYIIFLFILFLSCQVAPKTENMYYQTGEIKQRLIQDSANCYTHTEYFENGEIKVEGKVCDGIKEGEWKEWYIDGKLKWEGYFRDSIRVINYDKHPPEITIHGSPDNIYADTAYFLRINIMGVHPEDMIVTSNNGIIQLYSNRDEFDFVIIPKKIDELKLVVYVAKEQQMYQIGEKHMTVSSR